MIFQEKEKKSFIQEIKELGKSSKLSRKLNNKKCDKKLNEER